MKLSASSSAFYLGNYCPTSVGNFSNYCWEYFYSSNPTGAMSPSVRMLTSGVSVVCDINMKNSIQKKDITKKNYLDRILKLGIYTYKYNNDETGRICTGPIYQEVEEIFNGHIITDKYKKEDGTFYTTDYMEKTKMIQPDIIFYYHILAFQQFVNEQNNKNKELLERIVALELQQNQTVDAILEVNKSGMSRTQSTDLLLDNLTMQTQEIRTANSNHKKTSAAIEILENENRMLKQEIASIREDFDKLSNKLDKFLCAKSVNAFKTMLEKEQKK
jgi:hypothetical protein